MTGVGSRHRPRRDWKPVASKKPKVILVVMRKMITTLNAMLRDDASWQPQAA